MGRHNSIEPGDICEITDIHPDDDAFRRKEKFIGKRVVVEKIINERTCDVWLDVDIVLLDDAYPFKKGREVPFYKVKLRKILIN
jgi:hypothetical protein